MDDLREKVIKGLECCSQMAGEVCRKCPYANECEEGDGLLVGSAHLAADALSILKAQEPRLITNDDFVNADAWGTIPAWIEYNPAIEGAESGWAIIDSDILGSPFKKAWTARPTDEQRKAVKWNG